MTQQTANGRTAMPPARPVVHLGDPHLAARAAALQAAATFASSRVIAGQDISSADVLKVAEAFVKSLDVGS